MEYKRPSSSKRITLLNVLIVVCTLVAAVHLPVLSVQALSLDDDQYLTYNTLVQKPSWNSTWRFLTEVVEPSTIRGYYQPLTMVSLMIDYALGGRPDNLRCFHRTNLVLHIINTGLIIILIYLLFENLGVAAVVGLIFGVHPMTVEPVAWVAERKTLLASVFSLLSLISYVHFTRKNSWWLCLVSFITYVMALVSKPTSLPLPLVMVLLDYWPLRRLKRHTILEKLPFFLATSGFAVITYLSQARTGGIGSSGLDNIVQIPLVLCHNVALYLQKIVWPANLPSYYAFPRSLGLSNLMVLSGVLGSFVLFVLLLVSMRWTRAAVTGWLIFFVTLLPTMNIIRFTDVIASDKYAYLPSIGLLLIIASFLGSSVLVATPRKYKNRHVLVVLAVLLLASIEAVATRRCLIHWRETTTLYSHMLTISPNSSAVYNNLGVALLKQGKSDEAIINFSTSLKMDPLNARAHYNLALALRAQGKRDEAISHFRESLWIAPDHYLSHYNLGILLAETGDIEGALHHFHCVTHLGENSPTLLRRMAWVLATGRYLDNTAATEAVQLADRACQLTEYLNVPMLDSLAAAYAADGRFDLAVRTAERAIKLFFATDEHKSAINNIRARLQLYQQGKRYIEKISVQTVGLARSQQINNVDTVQCVMSKSNEDSADRK